MSAPHLEGRATHKVEGGYVLGPNVPGCMQAWGFAPSRCGRYWIGEEPGRGFVTVPEESAEDYVLRRTGRRLPRRNKGG